MHENPDAEAIVQPGCVAYLAEGQAIGVLREVHQQPASSISSLLRGCARDSSGAVGFGHFQTGCRSHLRCGHLRCGLFSHALDM